MTRHSKLKTSWQVKRQSVGERKRLRFGTFCGTLFLRFEPEAQISFYTGLYEYVANPASMERGRLRPWALRRDTEAGVGVGTT